MSTVHWEPMDFEVIGYLGLMLDDADEDSAAKQFDKHYQHGGGWRPFEGFKMAEDGSIQYGDPSKPDADPPYVPIARAQLRDEKIIMYHHGWVAIVQPDGTYEIARMD